MNYCLSCFKKINYNSLPNNVMIPENSLINIKNMKNIINIFAYACKKILSYLKKKDSIASNFTLKTTNIYDINKFPNVQNYFSAYIEIYKKSIFLLNESEKNLSIAENMFNIIDNYYNSKINFDTLDYIHQPENYNIFNFSYINQNINISLMPQTINNVLACSNITNSITNETNINQNLNSTFSNNEINVNNENNLKRKREEDEAIEILVSLKKIKNQ